MIYFFARSFKFKIKISKLRNFLIKSFRKKNFYLFLN